MNTELQLQHSKANDDPNEAPIVARSRVPFVPNDLEFGLHFL